MADDSELGLIGAPASTFEAMADIEAIKQVKYAYFRLLDSKEFDRLGQLLTDRATSSYESGKYSHSSREEIVEFLSTSLGSPAIVHEHLGHHPEIRLTSDETAVGYWYLHDRVIVAGVDFELGGTAIYRDEYEKVDGRWLISHTGYERVYEEQRKHSNGELTAFRNRFENED
jgi:SnoaL-like domain